MEYIKILVRKIVKNRKVCVKCKFWFMGKGGGKGDRNIEISIKSSSRYNEILN